MHHAFSILLALPLLACGAPSPAEVCRRLESAGCLSDTEASCRKDNEYLLEVTDRLGCEGEFADYLRCLDQAASDATCDVCLHPFLEVSVCIGEADSVDGELPSPPESDEPPIACQDIPTAQSFTREVAANSACTADTDCTTVPLTGSCFTLCPAAVNQSKAEKTRGFVQLLDDVYCPPALKKECPLPPAAECAELVPRCVDGACQ